MWSQRKFDLIVVGGGPAGTTAARYAAKAGINVLLLEKDRDIGVPVRCGEAASDEGLRIFVEPEKLRSENMKRTLCGAGSLLVILW